MKLQTQQTLRYFLTHIKQYKWLFAGMILSMTAAVVFEILSPLYYKEIFDVFAQTENKAELIPELFKNVIMIALLILGSQIAWRFCEIGSDIFQPKVMRNMYDECFQYVHRHSYRFFSDHFSGSLVRKVGRFVWAFNKFFSQIYWVFVGLIVRIILTIVILSWYNLWLGIIVTVWTLIFGVVNVYLAKLKYPADLAASKKDSTISGYLADTFTNTINVKLFTALDDESKAFAKKTEDWRKALQWSWRLGTYINAGQALFMGFLEIIVLVITIYLWQLDLVTVGFLFLVQAYVFGLFMRLWDLRNVIQQMYEAMAEAEEMIDILHTEHEVTDREKAKKLQVQDGRIEFKEVHFSYVNDDHVLKNFQLNIEPRQKVALVGHSGEGKTTITKLLMRFFDIQKGSIEIDGQNIAEVSLESLRQNISLVPQEPILFHRSLADNIKYGKRNASMAEVENAAKLANCHDFIKKLPAGYETFVGERGIKLSGGERQRVAIARAILEDAPIVILDEATSSLDSNSEKLIQQALHHLLEGKTSIIIAHRLSTIMEADRILVIERGKIIEDGTHRSLLRLKGGVYRHLWDIQAGGFIGE